MNPNTNMPFFYKSSNPGLAQVGEVASKLFQWDGTTNKPSEVSQGKAFMAPEEIEGEYIIWSDTYTLGYTSEADASPIFFSDGGQGGAKILQIINTVAFRLGLDVFEDLTAAMTWAASEGRIYVKDSFNPSEICDPNVTMPVLGNAGPGGLNLYFVTSATHRFNAFANGNALGYFETNNLTKTYACTLEFFKSADSIGGAQWFGYADGIYTIAPRTGTYELLQVGDVVYRDPYGNNFYPENHGFVMLGSGATIRDRFHWVSIGANGVVTSVDRMVDL